MKIKNIILILAALSLVACQKKTKIETRIITIPAEQQAGQENAYAVEPFTGGLRLNFQMSGITHIELESVDGYAIAGTTQVTSIDG